PPSSEEGPRDEGGKLERSPRSAYVSGTWAARESGPQTCACTPSQPPARLRTITCRDPDCETNTSGWTAKSLQVRSSKRDSPGSGGRAPSTAANPSPPAAGRKSDTSMLGACARAACGRTAAA